jgi:hypothetical protein
MNLADKVFDLVASSPHETNSPAKENPPTSSKRRALAAHVDTPMPKRIATMANIPVAASTSARRAKSKHAIDIESGLQSDGQTSGLRLVGSARSSSTKFSHNRPPTRMSAGEPKSAKRGSRKHGSGNAMRNRFERELEPDLR